MLYSFVKRGYQNLVGCSKHGDNVCMMNVKNEIKIVFAEARHKW